jgi:hypothetical protein
MKIVHTTTFIEQPFTSDAHIFSERPVSRDMISNLLYAQTVVEAKWLGEFPLFAVPMPAEPVEHSCRLFEDVHLICPGSWDVVDRIDTFLLNSALYELCKAEEGIYVNLKVSTAAELRALFDTHMFVMAAVGQLE